MPARKAPRAGERPSKCVSQAVSKTITSANSTNNSAEWDSATSWNRRGSNQRLANSKPTNNSTVLPSVSGSAQYQACSLLPANTGTNVSSNTATTSWNSNTPIAFWPWLLKISPRLPNSLLTMAVEESARPAPNSSAELADMPNISSTAPSKAPDATTCRLPRPKTTWRRASIFDSENSSPSEKSRNTTPNSARSGSSSLSLTQFSAVGPTINPAQR